MFQFLLFQFLLRPIILLFPLSISLRPLPFPLLSPLLTQLYRLRTLYFPVHLLLLPLIVCQPPLSYVL